MIFEIIGKILENSWMAVVVVPGLFYCYGEYKKKEELKIQDIDYRRKLLPFWESSLQRTAYESASKFSRHIFEKIRTKKLHNFPKIVLSYTVGFYCVFWLAGNEGGFLQLQIMPPLQTDFFHIDTLVKLSIFSILFLFATNYKHIHNILFLDNIFIVYALVAISVFVVWYFSRLDMEFLLIWVVLCIGSPLAMFAASMLFAASSFIDVTGIQIFLLYLVAMSAFSYLKQNNIENKRSAITIVFFVGVLLACYKILAWLYGNYLSHQNFSFTLADIHWITMVAATAISAFIVFINPKILLAPITALLATGAIVFVTFSLLSFFENTFPNNDSCYVFSKEILGGIALLFIVPFINCIFDYFSFFVTKIMLEFQALYESKVESTSMLSTFQILLFLTDSFLSALLIGPLVIFLALALSIFELLIIENECKGNGFSSTLLLLNEPFTRDSGWLVFVVFTTLVWTSLHAVLATFAYLKIFYNEEKRIEATTYLKSTDINPRIAYRIATWQTRVVAIAIPSYIILSILLAWFYWEILLDGYYEWVIEKAKSAALFIGDLR